MKKSAFFLLMLWTLVVSLASGTVAYLAATMGFASSAARAPQGATLTAPASAPQGVLSALPPSGPSVPPPQVQLTAGSSASMTEVVGRTLPSVVNISTSQARMRRGGEAQQSLGSGVIVSADGLVVTNHHVIADATRIVVHLSDRRDFEAQLVGSDSLADLALLRLVATNGSDGNAEPLNVTPIVLGDSAQLRQGDVVLAIGNPFGVGQTVTMGIVSATGRADMGISEFEDFIQTDASINPGNSGGALVSMNGELVGINTAILSRTGGNQGIGFAIPTNMVRPIVDSLLHNGKVIRGWLGVQIQDVTPELARLRSLPATQGVLIVAPDPNGPAAAAGLRAGDIIETLDNERMLSSGQLRSLVATRGSTGTVRLKVVRGTERLDVQVQLRERPQDLDEPNGFMPPGLVPPK